MNDSEVNLSKIGRLAGVGRAAVANWRRKHGDFPEPIGGTETSPTFQRTAAEDWLRTHGKLHTDEPPAPREPATVTFTGGPTVTLLAPYLSIPDGWSGEFEALSGFIPADAGVLWPNVGIERADVPGHEPFAATRANVDISYLPSATLRFLKLTWLGRGRRPVDVAAMTDQSTPSTQADR